VTDQLPVIIRGTGPSGVVSLRRGRRCPRSEAHRSTGRLPRGNTRDGVGGREGAPFADVHDAGRSRAPGTGGRRNERRSRSARSAPFEDKDPVADAKAFRVGASPPAADRAVGPSVLMHLHHPYPLLIEISYELAVGTPWLAPLLRLLEVGVPDKIWVERAAGNHARVLALVEQAAQFVVG